MRKSETEERKEFFLSDSAQNVSNSVLGAKFIIDCNTTSGVITTPDTTIVSPNYPSDYGEDLDCQVTITFEENILIVFDDFHVDQDNSDCDDWLEVRDGNSSNSAIIGEKICGDDIPSPMQSTGNSMTLKFHSNGIANYKGFKIVAKQGNRNF